MPQMNHVVPRFVFPTNLLSGFSVIFLTFVSSAANGWQILSCLINKQCLTKRRIFNKRKTEKWNRFVKTFLTSFQRSENMVTIESASGNSKGLKSVGLTGAAMCYQNKFSKNSFQILKT